MTHEFIWEGHLPAGEAGKPLFAAQFGESDLDAICTIENRTHPLGWKRSHFSSSLKTSHHHCVGLRVGEEWIAYAVISCIGQEAELLLLVVDQPWQGRGVGAAFLHHICTVLTGRAENLFLEVRASNQPAIALYEKLDFNQVGLRQNYYRHHNSTEDAVLFARTLGGFGAW